MGPRRARTVLLAGLVAYLALALALTWPSWRTGALLGHPGVDVYNHAWGLWWWASSLLQGELPWRTELLVYPRGGVLFQIDPVGAALALPISLPGGASPSSVALAWNAVAVLRLLLAGLGAHLLCGELSRPGPHCLLAGVAHMSSPYLLAEQFNGISEATSTGFVALALWGWARARRLGGLRPHLAAGLLAGLAAANTFYLGLAVVLAVAVVVGGDLALRRRGLLPALAGALAAAALALPVFLAFRASFEAPDAVLPRGGHQNLALILHNAVDPRELFLPGFRSFDFAAVGELFAHSLYLRWSLILPALLALWLRPRSLLPWALAGALALTCALGPYLVWGGQIVRLGSGVVALPFHLLQLAVPELAITHAARLGVAGIAVLCALAGAALADRALLALPLAALALAEGLWAAPVSLPLATAPAAIPPAVLAMAAAPGDPDAHLGVLDLPPQVNRTMYASRYLWWQAGHGRPIPYGPDPHPSRSGDNDLVLGLQQRAQPPAPDRATSEEQLRARLLAGYAWVVVHDDLDAMVGEVQPGQGGPYARYLAALLGPPTVSEGVVRAWDLRGTGAR
ncbi:hypothetical protein L6R53_07420 [Myxococcota bacterium]|nr:hypothetical protein [Myxococcota bacterium]